MDLNNSISEENRKIDASREPQEKENRGSSGCCYIEIGDS